MTMFVVLNIVLPALAVIVLLGVHWFVAKEFYAAAVMKGWTEKKYLYLALSSVDSRLYSDSRASRQGRGQAARGGCRRERRPAGAVKKDVNRHGRKIHEAVHA